MKRRDFVATTLAATAALKLAQTPIWAQTEENNTMNQEWYELRVYTLKPDSEATALHDFLREAAIPAWNRAGSQPIGVFSPREAGDKAQGEMPQLYVLIPHASLENMTAMASKLAEDNEYRKAGAAYLELPATNPAYVRYESSLMRAFAGMPRLILPPYSTEKKPRIFELRTYESHSESAALKKIEMFNGGEIDIMRRVGLAPVFYGEVLFGTRLPKLTYLLSAENSEAHQQHWGAFGKDAEWKKISAVTEYADAKIVSKISKTFLLPTAYSQI